MIDNYHKFNSRAERENFIDDLFCEIVDEFGFSNSKKSSILNLNEFWEEVIDNKRGGLYYLDDEKVKLFGFIDNMDKLVSMLRSIEKRVKLYGYDISAKNNLEPEEDRKEFYIGTIEDAIKSKGFINIEITIK